MTRDFGLYRLVNIMVGVAQNNSIYIKICWSRHGNRQNTVRSLLRRINKIKKRIEKSGDWLPKETIGHHNQAN